MQSHSSCGVVFIGTGAFHAAEIQRSIKSIREWNSDVPITVFTDRKLATESVDEVIISPQRFIDIEVLQGLALAPYSRSLYLSSSMRVFGPIAPVFSLLDRYDVLCAPKSTPLRMREIAPIDLDDATPNVPRIFPAWDPSVICLSNNARTRGFLNKWLLLHCLQLESYESLRGSNHSNTELPLLSQSLRMMLYQSEVRHGVLPPEFNLDVHRPTVLTDAVVIAKGNDLSNSLYATTQELVEWANLIDGNRLVWPFGSSSCDFYLRPNFFVDCRDENLDASDELDDLFGSGDLPEDE